MHVSPVENFHTPSKSFETRYQNPFYHIFLTLHTPSKSFVETLHTLSKAFETRLCNPFSTIFLTLHAPLKFSSRYLHERPPPLDILTPDTNMLPPAGKDFQKLAHLLF